MRTATQFCHAFTLLISLTSLNACTSRQTPNNPIDQRQVTPPVIKAKPLTQTRIPPALTEAKQSPWLEAEFLSSLDKLGIVRSQQGLWIQSSSQGYAAHQPKTPLSAASVTKVATTLAALHRLGPNHRFITNVGYQGSISEGLLQGDLFISGGDDPFFVWEDSFAIANLLTQLGIQQVSGDLVIQAPFVMNFESDPQVSGSLLQQGFNSALWSEEAIAQFNTLPTGTPKPNIAVQGNIRVVNETPSNFKRLVQHQSLPLVELLKRMNRYSNNPMADQIANHVGGAVEVTKIVRSLTGLAPQDVNFINGSGLGSENRITPQGATLMLQALSDLLQSQGMSLGDVMTVVGQDEGILDPRPLPQGLVVKSGTLDQVSALAGVLPTQTEGPIWFTILNNQGDVDSFRKSQEALLQKMTATWGSAAGEKLLTPTLKPNQLTSITQPL